MRKLFYITLLLFLIYEFLNNYLLMSYPGSQSLNSLEFSYFLSHNKSFFEIVCLLVIAYPFIQIIKSGKWGAPLVALLFSLLLYFFFNFLFNAEKKFRKPENLIFKTKGASSVPEDLMIIGVEHAGIYKAYPINYIRYHHRFIDEFAGSSLLITYCTLCRSARVFEPFVGGVFMKFRLAGINHSNALLEDNLTRSWWSQETGICLIGEMKGKQLNEIICSEMTLHKWIELHPATLIMQPDPKFQKKYRRVNDYKENRENPSSPEAGGTWAAHSYIVGITNDTNAIAIEWNVLKKNRIINEKLGDMDIIIMLSDDNRSFVAFVNPYGVKGTIKNDTLFLNNMPYDMAGKNLITKTGELRKLKAYREYWFSWQYAYPHTAQSIPN